MEYSTFYESGLFAWCKLYEKYSYLSETDCKSYFRSNNPFQNKFLSDAFLMILATELRKEELMKKGFLEDILGFVQFEFTINSFNFLVTEEELFLGVTWIHHPLSIVLVQFLIKRHFAQQNH